MALELIGAGFGRTGTLSLKVALEQLDVGPCYHMLEVSAKPERAQQWHDVVDGTAPDWDTIFHGYRSTVDWPAAAYWRALVAHWPDARVILSLRDPDKWYDSVMNTIYNAMRPGARPDAPDHVRVQLDMARTLIVEQTFGGRIEDRAHAIDVFERHNQAVIDAIPAHRLLVYQPGDGWAPLCDFLERPVPETDYPRLNDTGGFRARFGLPALD